MYIFIIRHVFLTCYFKKYAQSHQTPMHRPRYNHRRHLYHDLCLLVPRSSKLKAKLVDLLLILEVGGIFFFGNFVLPDRIGSELSRNLFNMSRLQSSRQQL